MARVLDAFGNDIYPSSPEGAFLLNVSLRHTVADAAGSFVWALRNPAAAIRTVRLMSIMGSMWFDGVAVAGANVGYELCRFTGADPTTGTTVPRSKKWGGSTVSVVADANVQQKSGVLTLTGIAGIEIMGVLRMGASVTNGIYPFYFDFFKTARLRAHAELAPGDGFGIRVGPGAAIIGQGLSGIIETEEKS
jgi:hypothetical protein